MKRLLAFAQLGAGLAGLLICGLLYTRFCEPMQNAMGRLDEIAGDAQIQADIGSQLLDNWALMGDDLQLAVREHQQSLASLQTTSQHLTNSLGQWEASLRDSSVVANNASQISRKFANYLPLRIPDIAMESRVIRIDVPQFAFQEQEVQLPFPSVSVGSRSKEIDLGLTSVKLDIPTLEVSTRNKKITVPSTPQITNQAYQFTIPDNLRVTYQEVFGDEKQLLIATSEQLQGTARAMTDSAASLNEVQELLTHELSASIQASQNNLAHAQNSLADLRATQIPAFKLRLENQRDQLSRTQVEFANLRGLIPWLFALAALLPLAISLHGLRALFDLESVGPSPVLK